MSVLIDLDQTLIDSQLAELYRKSREWNKVYSLIPQLKLYPGISRLLRKLNSLNIPICIVTSTPHTYCQRVIDYHDWNIQATVCYHDTKRRKPFPDPLLLGLEKLQTSSSSSVAIGDSAIDTESARSAHIFSIGALWGSLDPNKLIESQPDVACATVRELTTVLIKHLSIYYPSIISCFTNSCD